MTDNTNAQEFQLPAKPGPEHKLLDVFIGTWKAEGETKDGRTVSIQAMDSYEWLPGGYFLIHRTDARLGDDTYQSTEIMGYDAAQKAYFMRFFDSWGQTGTYQATVLNNTWTITGTSGRATIVVSDDGNTLTAHWEMSPNGSDWQPWMDMTLTKNT